MSTSAASSNFADAHPMRNNVHALVADLRHHKALVYWFDFGLSISTFWLTLGLAVHVQNGMQCAATLLLASLALYRAALFSHEIGHFGKSTLPGFSLAWNLLCGVPIMFPSFMLKSHVDHHGVSSYGTVKDPEYLPFAAYPQAKRWFWFGSLLVPWIFAARALFLVPASWVSSTGRKWLRARMDYMTMNNAYQPSEGIAGFTRSDFCVEALISIWAYALLLSQLMGWLPWRFGLLLLACMTLANLCNAWRTLRAHRYVSVGHPMSGAAQLRDSITFSLPLLVGELLCPVGQRFHAAHHLFPYLPYHALAEAHRRVLASDWEGRSDYAHTMQQV